MPFVRPVNANPLTPEEKKLLISEYLSHYREIAQRAVDANDFSELNVKLPRSAAQEFLDAVGNLLLEAAEKALSGSSEIQQFLSENTLPPSLHGRLPDQYRSYCLLLNSLKQWISAESAASDRWVLGGTAREKLKNATESCVVTGEKLERIELHHPVRDGRPPIPLSHSGHKQVETATEGDASDPTMATLRQLRSEGNRSWKALRDGCLSHMGEEISSTRTKNSLNSARTFAAKAHRATGKDFAELLRLLDDYEIGI